MYEYMTDFNNAEEQFTLIPHGTLAKVSLSIRSGNYGVGNLLTKNDKTGSIGLSVEFLILEGEHKNRKIIQLIGVKGMKLDEHGNDIWGGMGCRLIRAILESAHNISPKDNSDRANALRVVTDFSELQGLKCLVKIGIEEDKTGQYSAKNKVILAITPDMKDYFYLMSNDFNKPDFEPKKNGRYPLNREEGLIAGGKRPDEIELDDELPF